MRGGDSKLNLEKNKHTKCKFIWEITLYLFFFELTLKIYLKKMKDLLLVILFSSSLLSQNFPIKVSMGDAQKLLERKEYNTAIKIYDGVIDIDPANSEAYFKRGLTLSFLKKDSLAVLDFTSALLNSPKDMAFVYYNRAYSYVNLGKTDLAIADFSSAIKLQPGYVHALNDRGFEYERIGKLDFALADFLLASSLDSTNSSYSYHTARVYEKMLKPEKALIYFTKSINLNPKHKQAYMHRGTIYAQMRKFEKATSDFKTLLEFQKDNHYAMLKLGFCLYSIDKKDEACRWLEKSTNLGNEKAKELSNQICK